MKSRLEFRPEKISRRGEGITWALALISLATLVLLRTQSAVFSSWTFIFVGVMLISAASITLGNWVDRRTVLTLKPEGLEYRNGLRHVALLWDEVQAAQIFPSRWGDQVHILGKEAHFHFRTISEFVHNNKIRNRMGFAQGRFILEKIRKNCGLEEIDQAENGRYYARP